MNTQFFTNNSNQKFPLSTEALDFMQEQIKLAYGLTDLAGRDIIVKQSTSTQLGLVIFNGELMPLKGSPASYIMVSESIEQMTIEGSFVGNIRKTREAIYSSSSGGGAKAASSFTVLKSISTLMSDLVEAQRHTVPTGAIMMWSGTIDKIPAGWSLCDGNNGTPDLQGRFIVGATKGVVTFDSIGYNYPVGDKGGKNKVKLTGGESGVPAHTHTTDSQGGHSHAISHFTNSAGNSDTEHTNEWSCDGRSNIYPTSGGNGGSSATKAKAVVIPASYDSQTWIGNDYIQIKESGAHTHTMNNNTAQNAAYAHENRPVYYALAYIMKTI